MLPLSANSEGRFSDDIIADLRLVGQTTARLGNDVVAIARYHEQSVKTSLIFLILCCVDNLHAMPISFNFSGTITQFQFTQGAPGIAAGDSFQAVLTYDNSFIDRYNDAGNDFGRYYMQGQVPSMLFTVGNSQFSVSTGGLIMWAVDGVNEDMLWAQFDSLGTRVDTSWSDRMFGGASVILRDKSGTALNSDVLPTNINLSDFADERSVHITAGNGYGYNFDLTADLTSVNRVPETLPTGLTLGVVLIILVCCHRDRFTSEAAETPLILLNPL